MIGGVGQVDAYLFGADVFEQPVNTCNETQIDVLGITTGTLDAIPCPTQANQKFQVGFVMPIPDEAAGLGQLNITLQGRDSNNNMVRARGARRARRRAEAPASLSTSRHALASTHTTPTPSAGFLPEYDSLPVSADVRSVPPTLPARPRAPRPGPLARSRRGSGEM